jgi:hypothetical protein
MDFTLLWIALAAFVGAILHGIIQAPTSTKTNVVTTLITGFITAIVFAAGYKLQGSSLTILGLFLAIIGGYGVNAAAQGQMLKKTVATLSKPPSNKQPG